MPAKLIETRPAPYAAVDLDPIVLDIIENALRNARNEMDAVLFRTAMSPGIREQHDAFPMIANQEGKMVVGQFGSFICTDSSTDTKRHDRGRRYISHQRSLFGAEAQISHLNDWLFDDADFSRGTPCLLGGDVRPHDGRWRQGARLAAQPTRSLDL